MVLVIGINRGLNVSLKSASVPCAKADWKLNQHPVSLIALTLYAMNLDFHSEKGDTFSRW